MTVGFSGGFDLGIKMEVQVKAFWWLAHANEAVPNLVHRDQKEFGV